MNDRGISYELHHHKLAALLLSIVVAYIILGREDLFPFHQFLPALGYLGTFIAGFLYVFGFSSVPAAAILLILAKEQNLMIAGIVGGVGAVIGDLIIFAYVRYAFCDEVEKLSGNRLIQFFEKEEKLIFGHFQTYATMAFAGFLIASPLPTELGVSIMSTCRSLSTKKFVAIAFCLHTAAIFAILRAGQFL